MGEKLVRDLMVPLDEYAVVDQEATLLDAILALEKAQRRVPAGRQPHRAVLVADKSKKIIGKVGQLVFLNALEPKYAVFGDLGRLARAGVGSELVSSMMDHFRLFQDSLSDLCLRAGTIRVRDVMHPAAQNVDEDAPLSKAIHKIVMSQTLSILVTRGQDVVGLLRLSDLFEVIAEHMKRRGAEQTATGGS